MADNIDKIRSQMAQERTMVDKITQPTTQLNLINKVNEVIDNITITVDDTLSLESENPVQNKVVTSALNGKASTSAIPTKTSQLNNDSGFITSISSSDVTTALGYTPYSNQNPSGYEANKIDTIKVNGTAQTVTSKTVDITIPAQETVGKGNITIQRNGTAVGTINANATANSVINISVPTTASDVGALPDTTPIPTVNDANMVIKRNSTAVGTFTANQSSASTITISVPTQASDINALPSTTTITDLASATQMEAINSGVNSTVIAQVTTNKNNIASIQTVIPTAATASNQLADKNFVNSSISTNTAYFIGTFNSVAELEAYSGTLTNNDYAFVIGTDTAGNTVYNRYKYNSSTQEWAFEYAINNSSFTADQWAAINSGVTTTVVSQVTTNKNEISTIKSTLNTFGNIVTHSVAEFATAAQGSLADSALQAGDSNTLLTNDAGYITSISSGDVTTALGYTPYSSANPSGYQANKIETVKVNGTALTPSSKTVDITVPAAPTVNDSNMVIQRNGTSVGTFTANQSSASTINISVPTTASDVGALPDTTPIPTVYDSNMVIQRNGTAVGTFTANQTAASTINISVPTTASDVSAVPTSRTVNGKALTANISLTAADVGALPSDTTIPVVNDAAMVIQRNGTALGTFTANQSSAKTINVSVPTTAADVGALPDSTIIGSAYLTIKKNGTTIGSFSANATSGVAIDVTVPTKTPDITNDDGFINSIGSSDVTTALGYTPYSSANPSGYEANKIDTIKVNGTALTPASKVVDITIPAVPTVGDGNMVIKRNGTAVGTFTANQTAASTINISVPTTASDVGALPDSTVIGTGDVTIKRNGTDIATINVNQTVSAAVDISVPTQASDIGALPDSTTIGDGNMVIKRNNTAIGTFTANQTGAKTINISVPTQASDVGALPDSTFIPTVVDTYSATGTDAISGKGVASAITGLIKKTDLSATAPILYNNSTGVISASIDASVTSGSDNLISSGAVKTYVDNAIVGGVKYQGTWTATGQTDYSSITLPVKKGYLYYVEGSATISGTEWNTGDFLLVNSNVSSTGTLTDVSKIDNTEGTDIVRLNATQTLTNKTLSADSNSITNLTTGNFKSGVLATSVRATVSASDTVIVSEKGIAAALAGKANSGDIPTVNNANMVIQKNGTAVGTFTANQSSASTINITVPTTAADIGALPDTTTIGSGNVTIKRNGTAIGTVNANATANSAIDITVPTTAADIGALPDSTTIGEAFLTIKRNGTAIGSFGANATAATNIDITVPTKVSELTNDSSFISSISSSDVTTALGYTPYSSANPSGYQANVIETVKVNGTALTPTSKAIDITIPAAQTVGDGNMVIQRNGTAVGTFTANQTTAKTVNISVPTTASDVGALPDSTTIGSAFLTIKRNGTTIGSFGANATAGTAIDITVPTNTSDLTNNSGFITSISSSDVTTALGYTPLSQLNVVSTYSATGTAPINGTGVASAISGKQDTLVAGTGVTITGNTISATGSAITIDSTLSTTSTNPVQNKVITTALNNLQLNAAYDSVNESLSFALTDWTSLMATLTTIIDGNS